MRTDSWAESELAAEESTPHQDPPLAGLAILSDRDPDWAAR